MARIKRPTREEVNAEWKALNPPTVYTDAQLEEIDREIQRSFNGLNTRFACFRFMAHDGAGRMHGGTLAINPFTIEKTENKIRQWSAWRSRTYPFTPTDFSRVKTEVAETKTIVHHGNEEFDPADIPFGV